MRNLKKVLSLVLCMAMMLSIMVVGAGAAFSDQKEIKNTEAVDVCAALNIINGYTDGSFRPEGTITRAEACKMICVALNGGKEPVLGTSAVASFTDTKGHWAEGYIESCVAQGIVAGVGGGKFNPNGNVTGTQFAKMLLIALGYNADNEGYVGAAWEVEVNVDASAKGLYADLAGMDPSKALSRDNAAQMVWNALNAYEVEYKYNLVSENGQLVSKLVLQDKVDGSFKKITMLEDKYEAETYVETFNGNYDTGAASKEGQIDVGGKDFTYNFDLKYIGEEVKVVYKESKDGVDGVDNKDTIYGVYVTGETDVVYATSNDVKESGTATDGKIKINDTKYDVAAITATAAAAASEGPVVVITNYGGYDDVKAATTTDAEAKFVALGKQNGDTIKFILNDDGEVAVAYVTKTVLENVTAVSSAKVTISGLGTIELKDNDVYSGIAKNDVVAITRYYDTTAADAYTVVEKADVVSGEVTSFKANESVTIDGTVYKIYNKSATMPSTVGGESGIQAFTTSHIGEKVDLYLVNGYVAAAVQTTESASNYSLVINANGGSAGNALNPLKIQVLDAQGDKHVLVVSDKGATPVVGDIVTYTMSGDEAKITVEAAKSAAAQATADFYDKDAKTVEGTVTSANCVLFVQTEANGSTNSDGTYKAYSIRNLKNISAAGKYYTTVEDDGKIVAAYINLQSAPTGSTSDVVYGIVTEFVGVIEIDDINYNQYKIWAGEEIVANIEDGAANDTLSVGTIYGFAPSSDRLYDDNTAFASVSNASLSSVTVDSTTYTADVVWVDSYDEAEQLLSYYTAVNVANADGLYTGNGQKVTKAVADDVVITYVDVDNDDAGEEIGVETNRWAQNGYADAIIIFNSDGAISHIIIETSGENNVYAQ